MRKVKTTLSAIRGVILGRSLLSSRRRPQPNRKVFVMLPIFGLLAFTGCASIDGTAGHQPVITNQAAVYLEHGQQKTVNPDDQEPDPTYEWFY